MNSDSHQGAVAHWRFLSGTGGRPQFRQIRRGRGARASFKFKVTGGIPRRAGRSLSEEMGAGFKVSAPSRRAPPSGPRRGSSGRSGPGRAVPAAGAGRRYPCHTAGSTGAGGHLFFGRACLATESTLNGNRPGSSTDAEPAQPPALRPPSGVGTVRPQVRSGQVYYSSEVY